MFTSSIAVYGAGQLPMTEDAGPAARGPVRGVEVRGRAGPGGGPANVRPRPRDLPPAQRLRRAAEHRRQVPQRHRHLHEPAAAGAADDDLRRRPPDPGVLAHRRRRADHRPAARSSRPRATRRSTSGPTRPTPCSSWPRRSRGRWLPLQLEHLPARKEVVTPLRPRQGRARLRPPEAIDLRTGIDRMAAWVRERGPASPVEFSEIEIEKNLPPSWRVRQPVLGGES